MIKLAGAQLERLPISGLKKAADLLEYDGPLLSHFVHPHGDHFLYYWCDCTKSVNRWMVLRVPESRILRLMSGVISLDEVLPKSCQDDFVYFVDLDSSGSEKRVELVAISDIPKDYTPNDGVFLPGVSLSDDDSYTVLVEGDWDVQQWGEFPRRFSQIYSVLYGLNESPKLAFDSHPWRGDGFSSMHFYNESRKRVPEAQRPAVTRMQYASPGFMKFSLCGVIGRKVAQCVSDLKTNNVIIAGASSKILEYIKTHDLNSVRSSSDPKLRPHSSKLASLAKQLMSGFSEIDEDQFVKSCPGSFEAAKISRSFYLRVSELASFEKRNLVRFPRIKS